MSFVPKKNAFGGLSNRPMNVSEPSSQHLKRASRGRLKRTKEHASDVSKKKFKAAQMDEPFGQSVMLHELNPVTNSKSQPKCGFCGGTGHKINHCSGFQACGTEYNVADDNNSRAIVARIRSSMPAVIEYRGQIVGTLSGNQLKMNAIIHEAYTTPATSVINRSVDNMCFKVSLIATDGQVDKSASNMVIPGSIV